MTYTVVLLDGKERQNLSLEEIKDLFFKRQINQSSLVNSPENPQWQMLKRVFDVSMWIPSNAPQNPPPVYQDAFQASQAAYEQQNPFNQPVTFNQFPQNQNNQSNNNYHPPNDNFAQNTSNGYSQNNQTETYYQAETSQSQYNFQNNQANFAPSNYNNPPNNYGNSANNHNYSSNSYNNARNSTNVFDGRLGLRPAAAFLVVNVILNIIITLIENLMTSSAPDSSGRIGGGIGRIAISLIVDLVLASKLWKNEDIDNARKWVLIRTYLGFVVFGIAVPFFTFQTGQAAVGIISFVAYLLFFISVALVLHGKQSPAPSRVMAGIGTFALFALFNIGILGISSIVLFAPNLSSLDVSKTNLDKYKIEGTEFLDKTTGAKVVLPEGWSMLSLDNPLIHTPEARMIAVDKPGNRLTLLEVVPVPGNLDMKQVNSLMVLDQLSNEVVKSMKEDAAKDGTFRKNSFTEITRMNIYVGKHPAKLLVFEKTADGEKVKGHMIITYDELTFYVLHSWCPAEEYDKAQSEFTFFEKNFTVPEKINSPFTQSAEIEKNKTSPKKNF